MLYTSLEFESKFDMGYKIQINFELSNCTFMREQYSFYITPFSESNLMKGIKNYLIHDSTSFYILRSI